MVSMLLNELRESAGQEALNNHPVGRAEGFVFYAIYGIKQLL